MAADEDDLETIEVLSTQYQPTPSVNGFYRPVPNYNEDVNVPQIRSVDDYEKQPPSFYFRPPTGSSSVSSNNYRAGGGKSTPHSTKEPTLISLPLRDGESDGSQTVKEPLTADEKKRKRITFAVGVIAGTRTKNESSLQYKSSAKELYKIVASSGINFNYY